LLEISDENEARGSVKNMLILGTRIGFSRVFLGSWLSTAEPRKW